MKSILLLAALIRPAIPAQTPDDPVVLTIESKTS